MAEPTTPLEGTGLIEQFNAGTARHRVTAQVLATGGLTQLTAWPATDADVREQLSNAGFAVPEAPGEALESAAGEIWSVAFGRYLVLGKAPDLPSAMAAVCDLGHARLQLGLTGTGVAPTLARGIAVDYGAWRPGEVVQSAIHGVGVTILRREGEAFDLLVPRAFAESFMEWMIANAAASLRG